MNLPAWSRDPRIKLAAKCCIATLVLFGLGRRIYLEREKLRAYEFSFDPSPFLASSALYLLGLLTFFAVWHLALLDQQHRLPWHRGIPAYYVSQLGKFIPGKAFVVIIRHSMIRSSGIKFGTTTLTTIQENLLTMVAGALLATGLLCFTHVPLRPLMLPAAAAIGLGFGLLCLPPVIHILLRFVLRQKNPNTTDPVSALQPPGWHNFSLSLLAAAIGWICFAASLHLAIATINATPDGKPPLPLYLLAISIATVGGFFSFLPSGLGAREFLLVETLAPTLGADQAIVTAIILRLAWVGAEASTGLLFGLPFLRQPASHNQDE